MALIVIDSSKCDLCGHCVDICPFNACEITDGKVEINAACKMCRLCIKKCPNEAISIASSESPKINKDEWKGIMIFVEHHEGIIHPITYELAGKAAELARKIGHPVYAVFIGSNISAIADELTAYGIDRVFVYDYEQLKFLEQIYTQMFLKTASGK